MLFLILFVEKLFRVMITEQWIRHQHRHQALFTKNRKFFRALFLRPHSLIERDRDRAERQRLALDLDRVLHGNERRRLAIC